MEEQNGGNRISLVEQCACPIGYSGFSCEVGDDFHPSLGSSFKISGCEQAIVYTAGFNRPTEDPLK